MRGSFDIMLIVKEKEHGYVLQKNGLVKQRVLLTSDYIEEERELLEKSSSNNANELKDGTY